MADELGATKIALGHHRDDILQTLLLNMFFGGKLKSMPPKLVSDDGKHVVIRPLAFVGREGHRPLGAAAQFPHHPVQPVRQWENLQRKQVGEMLREWEKKYPGRVENMFNALQNVVPSHLLDGALYDFKRAQATGVASDDGDKAFDQEEFPAPPGLPACRSCAWPDTGTARHPHRYPRKQETRHGFTLVSDACDGLCRRTGGGLRHGARGGQPGAKAGPP